MFNWRGLYFPLRRTRTIRLLCTGPELGTWSGFVLAKRKQCSVTGDNGLQRLNHKWIKRSSEITAPPQTENPHCSPPYKMAQTGQVSIMEWPHTGMVDTVFYRPLHSLIGSWSSCMGNYWLLALLPFVYTHWKPKGIFKFYINATAEVDTLVTTVWQDQTMICTEPARWREATHRHQQQALPAWLFVWYLKVNW